MKTILIMNGPNLSMLGKRDPKHYGSGTLQDLEQACICKGIELGVEVQCFQSESESAIVSKLHRSMGKIDGIVLNAGAYTHYSIAIRDAIELIHIPVMEVHLSDIHNRESFRNQSVIEAVCARQYCGMGVKGYLLAMEDLVKEYFKEDADTVAATADELSVERAAIDEIDRQMIRLFEQRMKHADRIAKIKAKSGTAVLAASREEEILDRTRASIDESYAEYACQWMKETMRLSRARQNEVNGKE